MDLTVPPVLLLDNPHLLSERMRESSDVMFLYTYPTLLERLVLLLVRLTEMNDDDRGLATGRDGAVDQVSGRGGGESRDNDAL